MTSYRRKKTDMIFKEGFYRHIFNTEFNLGFESPTSDTCSTCDDFDEKYLDQHNGFIKNTAEEMKKDREEAKANPGIVFISFDQQQAMPLPKISTSVAFYLIQLWMYKFGVYLIQTKDESSNAEENGFVYSWIENKGGRGPNKIISSLHAFMLESDVHGETLIA